MLEPSGEVEFRGAILPVFQCDDCTVPWDLGDGEPIDTAYTFAVTEDGQVFDPTAEDSSDSLLP